MKLSSDRQHQSLSTILRMALTIVVNTPSVLWVYDRTRFYKGAAQNKCQLAMFSLIETPVSNKILNDLTYSTIRATSWNHIQR